MTRLDPGGDNLPEIERRLDRMLHDQLPDPQFATSLRLALHEWSQAVWTAAKSPGAQIPTASEVERGLRLAQQPVFVVGPARSGTTLLRDLLDGHPELVVIPSESAFYTDTERALFGMRPDLHLAYLACRWLERLADPPPFWLLGASRPDGSPYVTFARDFAGWWQTPEQHRGARTASWPLVAFALAYAQWLGGGRLPLRARLWVEKSPGSERSLARIWQDFPRAKVIQIVRRPEAVLASVKRMPGQRWGHRRTLAHIARQMAPSFRIAARNCGHLPRDRFSLVRYEDLTADPEGVMVRIAEFLGIEPLPSLLRPTVAGRPAINNSSFGPARPELRHALGPIDRALLALAVARQAAKLGYTPDEPIADGHAIVGGLTAS